MGLRMGILGAVCLCGNKQVPVRRGGWVDIGDDGASDGIASTHVIWKKLMISIMSIGLHNRSRLHRKPLYPVSATKRFITPLLLCPSPYFHLPIGPLSLSPPPQPKRQFKPPPPTIPSIPQLTPTLLNTTIILRKGLPPLLALLVPVNTRADREEDQHERQDPA
jgi:hypothetical protein